MQSLRIENIIINIIILATANYIVIESQDTNCDKFLLFDKHLCDCRSHRFTKKLFNYYISCENPFSLFDLFPIIQIQPINKSLIDFHVIKILTVSNRKFNKLDENEIFIETPLKILELQLTNDSIQSVLPISILSELVNLTKLVINQNPLISIDLTFLKQMNQLKILNLNTNSLSFLDFEIVGKESILEELYLSENNFTSFETFLKFPYLTVLDLSNNFIKKIKSYSNIKNLKNLYLSNNLISFIEPFHFVDLVNLRILDIEANQLANIESNTFSGLFNLTNLVLSYNRITSIARDAFDDLKNLFILSLEFNRIKLINSDLNNNLLMPRGMKEINLKKNSLEIISNEMFSNLTYLSYLDLSFNLIYEIEAESFLGLINLQTLNLKSNWLTFVNSSLFSGLSSLKNLDLGGNRLLAIMSNTFVSLSMDTLDLSNQNIEKIESEAILNCKKLKSLVLKVNQLRVIKLGQLSNLEKLEELDLSQNLIEEISTSTFTGPFENIKKLILDNNLISSIKPSIFTNLTKLEYLYLKNNILRDLNSHIFNSMKRLFKLVLSENKIDLINAKTFTSSLKNLNELWLDGNSISIIEPYSFANLSNLALLDLDNNLLEEINSNIFSGLFAVSSLYLQGNRILYIAKEAFNGLRSLKALFLRKNYLKSLDSGVFNGLNNLELIDISFNKLEKIDNAFEKLSLLKIIYLGSNQLRQIDNRTFSDAPELAELDLSDNPLDQQIDKNVFDHLSRYLTAIKLKGIQSNPSDFLNLSLFKRLNSVDMSQTRFLIERNTFQAIEIQISILYLKNIGLRHVIYLPIEKMVNIRIIDISDNPLDWSVFNNTFRFIPKADSLEELFLSNTSLKDIKLLGLDNVFNLKTLDLSNNLIENIESNFFKFKNRFANSFYLSLSNNRIKTIQSNSFGNIFHLDTLKLNNNQLLNDSINFQSLYWLKYLDLSYSYFNHIPLFDIINRKDDHYLLETMFLSHNSIESIGSSYFNRLINLEKLDLSQNKICRVDSPDVFYGATKLKTLNLSSNLIDTKALEIINLNLCANLELLDISNNKINTINSYLFNGLKKLKSIDLSYNQLVQIDTNSFNSLISLRELFIFEDGNFSSNEMSKFDPISSRIVVTLQENFIKNCNQLKILHVSSIDFVRYNFDTLSNSLIAVATNKKVNEAIYYNSINIKINNYDFFENDVKSVCELTIELLKKRIHLNLFDDMDMEIFMQKCFSLDLIENE